MGQSISTCICAPACLGNLVTKRLTSGAPVKAQGCGNRMPSTIERFSTRTFWWSQYSRVTREVRERYVAQDLEYDRYSDHTNELVRECERKSSAAASAKTASEIARKLLDRGRPVEEIVEDSGLTAEEIEALRASSTTRSSQNAS